MADGHVMTVAAFVVSLMALIVALAQSAERRAIEVDDRHRVVWQLDHIRGQIYQLTNDGNQAAFDVYVDLVDVYVDNGTSNHFAEFEPAKAVQYMLARGLGSTTTEIAVTWHEMPDACDAPRQQGLSVHFWT